MLASPRWAVVNIPLMILPDQRQVKPWGVTIMPDKDATPVRSSRRNDPWSLALFLCAYGAIMAFILLS